LRSIVIPDSVKIEKFAFYGCYDLPEETEEKILSINPEAFFGKKKKCKKIKKEPVSRTIYYESSEKLLPKWNKWIDKNSVSHTFADGKGEIVLKDSVRKIEQHAFDDFKEISEERFEICNEIMTSIVIPDSIIEICYSAFRDCKVLKSVFIPDSVIEISRHAFLDCKQITVDKNNPEYDSRNNCNAIIETETNTLIVGCSDTVIPDSVTEIGYEAFDNCISLKSIVIPDSVTKIGDLAFHWCTSLESIVLPDSVTEIGVDALGVCRSLTSIVIPDSVTKIGGCAFSYCISLKSVVIPKTITEISYALFRGCKSLESVVIPDSVTKIDESAFYECESLQSIVIPDSVTEIEKFAFYGCDKLPEETKEKILSINPKAFDEDENF